MDRIDQQEDRTPYWRSRWFGQWDTTHPATQRMLMEGERWAKRVMIRSPKAQRVLVVYGSPQTGKTRMAKAIAKYWRLCAVTAWDMGRWPKPPSVECRQWSMMAETPPQEREGLWADVARANLVVIDDVGAEVDQFGKGRPLENLRMMLEERVKDGADRWTIVTTNISPTGWKSAFDDRILGRLSRDTLIVSTDGAKPWRRDRTE